ncbi:MAG: hypothetical protein AAF928_03275 [Myxococcota bacterium]
MSEDIVERFLADTSTEDPKLAGALTALDDTGRKQLAGVLGRFDAGANGTLGATERLHARRVLGRLRRPDVEVLTEANKVLDYLDLNADAKLDRNEIDLTLEVMEMFSRIEGGEDTMSAHELRLLFAVLRHLDADDSGRLERDERAKLRSSLTNPDAFWADQQANNPRVKALLT